MHEKLQVNTALISGHSHDGVRRPLVTLVEQLGDKPNRKARLFTGGSMDTHLQPPTSVKVDRPPSLSAPEAHFAF